MKNGMYTSLADAAEVTGNPAYGQGTTKVWFQKSNFMRDGMMGFGWLEEKNMLPTRSSLEQTHVLIGSVNLEDPEDVFMAMQGEVWSPEGEARGMIGALASHTTMCVGDIVEVNGQLFLVDGTGFKKLDG